MPLMDNINKGIATLNVKTSTLMESSKYKTLIANKENEIHSLKQYIGEMVYLNRSAFSLDMVNKQIAEIEEKYAAIEDLKKQLAVLVEYEKSILGTDQGNENIPKIFCPACGTPNEVGSKFCEHCGNKIGD